MPINRWILAVVVIVLSISITAATYYALTTNPRTSNASPTANPSGSGTPTETSTVKGSSSPSGTNNNGESSSPQTSSSIQTSSPTQTDQSSSPTQSTSLSPTLTPQTTSLNPSTSSPTFITPAPTLTSPFPTGTPTLGNTQYIVLSWNDLGMHCYNPDFEDICVLPPYNNLIAQVVRKGGEDAHLVTSGITVSYFFPENTYSAGKTNFWDYANQTFDVNLPENAGLTGNGLSGIMKQVGIHYEALGIPLTEYTDQNPTTRQPYQEAIIVVTDSSTGTELCRTQIVGPVSTEMRCDTCHGDNGLATLRYPITPTNKTETNILTLHDYLHVQTPTLMDSRPVLCANCHSDNALGTVGKEGLPNLSNAVHSNHDSPTIPLAEDKSGCYSCHPGPNTQCLRDVMSVQQNFQCQDCHGDLTKVSTNPDPWLNEPKCDNPDCHGNNATLGLLMNNPLYKSATGMGGVFCEGCHDSTHAIAPSRVAADDVKFVALQGNPNQLTECTVCHGRTPDEPFFHSGEGERDSILIPYFAIVATATAVIIVTSMLFSAAVCIKRHKKSLYFSS